MQAFLRFVGTKQLIVRFCLMVVLMSGWSVGWGQVLWSTTGSGGAWLSTGNWTGGTVPGINGYAQFQLNPTGAGQVGINMNGSTNNGANNQAVGGIEVTGSRAVPLVLGNSTTSAAGVLTFNGTTINSVANTIIRNTTGQLFTIQQNIGSGSSGLTVALGNTTNNIISIEGTGGVTITIPITGTSDKNLTKAGSGSGVLTLSGVNTYSGNTNINGGTLSLSGTGSIANSPQIILASGAGFNISSRTGGVNLGASQSLRTSASGGNTTGTITVAASTNLTLSSGGLVFTSYGGANGNSSTNAPLTVTGATAGSLALNNAPVTVTTTAALTAGTYKLIAKGGSATGVTGTPGTLTVGGSGLAAGTTGALSVVSGELILTVTSTGPSTNANLSALSLSTGTLAPAFAANTTSYSATVPFAASSITVTATRADANATLQVRVNGGSYTALTSGSPSGSLPLNVGSNTIDVLVTAQDGITTKTYTTTVTRTAASTNADLSSLSTTAGVFSPAFNAAVTGYTVSVANGVTSTTVTATVADATASLQVRINGGSFSPIASGVASSNLSLNVGENTIDVLVTAQDGTTTKVYSLTVNRAASLSSNADLSALSTTAGTLSPAFDAGITAYTSSVAFNITSVTVTATKADPGATLQVRINGGTYSPLTSGAASSALNLNTGANPIDVLVTAEDGITTKLYTITVTRAAASTVSSLSSMTFSSGTLTPSFASNVTAYTTSVSNAITSITVTSVVTDAASSIQVRVNGGGFTSVASGVASGALTLNVGNNTVDVRVTAEDGTTTTTYTTTVTRAGSNVSSLSNITISSGTLSPSFATATTTYSASVFNSVNSVTVTPTVTQANATVQVRVNGGAYNGVTSGNASGALPLNVGSNSIEVLVTAQDGVTTTNYTITVTRADANAVTVIWTGSSTDTDNPNPIVGNITAGKITKGSGVSGALNYGSNGVNTSGWGTTGFDATDYYQYIISPSANYTLTVNSIAATTGLSGSGNTATGTLQYSYSSSFTSPQTIGSTFAVTSSTATNNFTGLSIVVSSGQTLYVRLFVYKGTGDNITGLQTVRSKDFTISGTSIQLLSPPVLTAASGATVDNAFNVTFTDDPASQAWVAAGGTTVTVGGVPLTAGFSIANGQITFTPSASVPAGLLQTAGANKAIVISKSGYTDATVSQTINAGAPSQLTVSTQPAAPTISGGTLSTQPAVTVRDQYSNLLSGITVNTAVTSGQTSNWSLGGTTSATTNASGVATFSNLTATNLGATAFTTATLTFTPGTGSGSVNSNQFTVPPPATKLVITNITPSSPTAGAGFNVTVQSQNAANTATNVLTATGISLSTNDNAGAIGGTTTGTINAGSNAVTITGVVLPNAGTGVTLTATQTSGTPVLTAGTSNTFTVLDAASYLTFENVPATGSAGTNLSSFTVSARRSSDNSVDQAFTGSITISKNSGPGTLSGTLSVNAVNGVATFNAAQFNQSGTYTLAASSGSLTGATSGNIVVSLANAPVIQWAGATGCVTGSGTTWLTAASWCGGALPSSTTVAQFGNLGSAGTIGINLNGITLAQKTIGAIELSSSSTIDRIIRNSSTTVGGDIILSGVVVNTIPNIILRNNSSQLLTLQNGTSQTMNITLGNITDNVISVEGTGGITISSVISGTGRSLTKAGNGSGILTLTGNNTYTGATTVTGGTLSIPKTGYTATITTSAVTVAFSPAPAIGTYTFLPGALTNGGQTFSATGLAANQTASFNFANSTVTVSLSQATADYRSKQSGNFNDASTWEYFNGIVWTDATQVPSSTNNVTVQNGHTITQDANFTVGTTKSLTLNATSSWVVSPNVILTVTGTANFNNQSVVFKSTAAGDGMFGNSSGTINDGGNVTVERYLGSVNKRAWRLLTAPVSGSTNNSVFYNWQNDGASGVAASTGAEIWGPGGTGAGGNGLAVGPLNSLRTFNNATQSFVDVTDSKAQPLFNTSNNNPTFYLFLSGPYGSGNITNTSIFSPTTLRAKGSLLTGNKQFSTSAVANGFYFVSNPYASTVNHGNSGDLITPSYPLNISNATNAIYFWDPNLAGLFGAGGYVAFDRLQNTYSIPPGEGPAGTLTYQSGGNYTRLQSGSAFVLQAVNAGTISVDFTEAAKGGAASPGVFRTIGNTSEKIRITLQRSSNGNFITTDGTVAFYYDNANAGVDRMDAAKFNNNSDNLMLRRNGRSLTFEHRPTVVQHDTLFMGLANTSATAYRFVIEASDFGINAGLRAVLQDLYLNTESPINLYGTTTVAFMIDGNAASTGNNRFRIVLRPDATTSVGNANAEKWMKVYPNPVAKGASLQVELKNRTAGTYQMVLYNALGMQVYRVQFVHGGSNTVQRIQLPASLSNGVYVAEIMDAKGNKEEIKITIQ